MKIFPIFPYTKSVSEDGTVLCGYSGKERLFYSKPFWIQWSAYRPILWGLWNCYILRPYDVMQEERFAMPWWEYIRSEWREDRQNFKDYRRKNENR